MFKVQKKSNFREKMIKYFILECLRRIYKKKKNLLNYYKKKNIFFLFIF